MPRWHRRHSGADLGEIEEVYRGRLGELRRVAAAITGDQDDAGDVVQEAFVTAVRRRGSFRGDGPLEAWLWRIVVNHARSARRGTRTAVDTPPEETASANGDGGVPGGYESVRAAIL